MKRTPQSIFFALGLLAPILATGCGGGAPFSAPVLSPLIDAALPASLRSTGGLGTTGSLMLKLEENIKEYNANALIGHKSTRNHILSCTPDTGSALSALAAIHIQNLFQNTYTELDGSTTVGYVHSLVGTLDGGMAGLSSANYNGTCQRAAAKTFLIDLSSIDPLLNFTLGQVQCSNSLSGNATGAGKIFGKAGSDYSLWTSLGKTGTGTFTTNGGFMLMANVTNAASTSASSPEIAEGIHISYSPLSGVNQISLARFKANATAGTFELAVAQNGGSFGGTGPTNLGAGFRMNSDGTLIYADGLIYNPGNTDCGWQEFSTCITAATMTVNGTATDCTDLATTFSFATTRPSGNTGLNFWEATGGTQTTATIPAPTTVTANQTPPTATVINALNAVFPISSAGTAVTAYTIP